MTEGRAAGAADTLWDFVALSSFSDSLRAGIIAGHDRPPAVARPERAHGIVRPKVTSADLRRPFRPAVFPPNTYAPGVFLSFSHSAMTRLIRSASGRRRSFGRRMIGPEAVPRTRASSSWIMRSTGPTIRFVR